MSRVLLGAGAGLLGAGLLYSILPLTNENDQEEKKIVSKKHDDQYFPQYLVSNRGNWLYYREWLVPSPRGAIFICHGFGEHINRYAHVASYYNKQGLSVFGMDHHGHGLSDGERAYCKSFQDYVDDFIQFTKLIVKKHGLSIPLFLLGHSMGGAISIEVMKQSYNPEDPLNKKKNEKIIPWNSCILSAPAIIADPSQVGPVLKSIASFFSSVFPKLQLTKLDISTLSRIKSVVSEYELDPLVYHGSQKARWGNEMLTTMARIEKEVKQINFPFFIVHGTGDLIVKSSGSVLFFNESSTVESEKAIKLYQGAYHEMFNDENKDEVLQDVYSWINQRLKSSK